MVVTGYRSIVVGVAPIEESPRCSLVGQDVVGESPVWHSEQRSLYWCDICSFTLHRYVPHSGARTLWKFEEPVVGVALTDDPETLLLALGSRIVLWNTVHTSAMDIAWPEPDWPRHRLNDGGVAPDGSYWVGSMPNNVGADGELIAASGTTGSLYRVDAAGQVERHDGGFAVPNTCVFSPDGRTLYCGDTAANAIYAYDLGPSGLSGKRVFTKGTRRGVPDGSAVDADGFLWNSRFGGGCIVRFAPDGTEDCVIDLPVSNVTHCAFGGDDGRTLYATTARLLAPPDEALAGSIFELRTTIRGLPPQRFSLQRLQGRTR